MTAEANNAVKCHFHTDWGVALLKRQWGSVTLETKGKQLHRQAGVSNTGQIQDS